MLKRNLAAVAACVCARACLCLCISVSSFASGAQMCWEPFSWCVVEGGGGVLLLMFMLHKLLGVFCVLLSSLAAFVCVSKELRGCRLGV